MDQATSLTVSSVQDSQSSSRTAVNGSRTVVVLWTGRRQGRLDEDEPRQTAALEGRSSTTFFTLIFYSYFLFLFLFSALTYLSTSICLIDQYCVLVVDGRPPRLGRRQGSPSRPRTRQSRPSSSSPRLGRTGRLELVTGCALSEEMANINRQFWLKVPFFAAKIR